MSILYHNYITNDRQASAAEIVFGCHDRCDQENLIAQIAGGVRALSAPVDILRSAKSETFELATFRQNVGLFNFRPALWRGTATTHIRPREV